MLKNFRIPEIALGVFLAVAVFAMGMTFQSSRQPQQPNTYATPQKAASDKIQNDSNKAQSLWVPTDSVGLYTLVLSVFTGLLFAVSVFQGYFLLRADNTARIAANAAQQSAEHIPRVERAYVKMSHQPPGIVFEEHSVDPLVKIALEVRNFGNTPATITDVVITIMTSARGTPLPPVPSYTPAEKSPVGAFLVSNDTFLASSVTQIPKQDRIDIEAGVKQLHVAAYVDYIDQFGKRQRGGYARKYQTGQTKNNLLFVEERGYNYDRLRLPGEGNDWGENS